MSAFFGRGRRIFIHTRLPPAASNRMAAPGPDSREAKTRRPVTAISSASPVPVTSWPWPRLQSRSVARSRNLAPAGAQRLTDGQRRQDNQVGRYGVVPWKWGTPWRGPLYTSSEEEPMTTATISPWPLVRQGDQEHPVQTLQYLLRARGHNLTVDGIFGPATDAAVRAFQQQRAWPSTASSAPSPGRR